MWGRELTLTTTPGKNDYSAPPRISRMKPRGVVVKLFADNLRSGTVGATAFTPAFVDITLPLFSRTPGRRYLQAVLWL